MATIAEIIMTDGGKYIHTIRDKFDKSCFMDKVGNSYPFLDIYNYSDDSIMFINKAYIRSVVIRYEETNHVYINPECAAS